MFSGLGKLISISVNVEGQRVAALLGANEEQSRWMEKQPHLIFVIELLESHDPYLQLPLRKFSFIHFEMILCQKHKQVFFRAM